MGIDFPRLQRLARKELAATLRELPGTLRDRASALPVTIEELPSPELQADGIAPDTLGLFVGPAFADEPVSSVPIPPQIILFLENLWEQAEHDEEFFREEVHTTYLHELGHYLGLDEDDLFERGLE
jgi:predicted Zn-dependent protease with MMP-like domain